jgi:hypothetical protein
VYVSRPSATDPDVAPEGHENLFVLVPVACDPDMPGDTVEKIADATLELIAERAGVPGPDGPGGGAPDAGAGGLRRTLQLLEGVGAGVGAHADAVGVHAWHEPVEGGVEPLLRGVDDHARCRGADVPDQRRERR